MTLNKNRWWTRFFKFLGVYKVVKSYSPTMVDSFANLESKEELAIVNEALKEIGFPFNEILIQKAMGYSYKEIQDYLANQFDAEYAMSSLKQLTLRGKKRLREALKKRLGD